MLPISAIRRAQLGTKGAAREGYGGGRHMKHGTDTIGDLLELDGAPLSSSGRRSGEASMLPLDFTIGNRLDQHDTVAEVCVFF